MRERGVEGRIDRENKEGREKREGRHEKTRKSQRVLSRPGGPEFWVELNGLPVPTLVSDWDSLWQAVRCRPLVRVLGLSFHHFW